MDGGGAASPGQYASPATWTPAELAALPHDNAGPKLVAAIWTLTALALVFLGLRVYCRLLKAGNLWWDDAVLIAAWVCMAIESGVITYLSSLGYGLHIWDFNMNNMAALMLPTNVAGTFSATAAVWAKTSFGITLLKITDGWMNKLTWFAIISMNIAMGLTALFPWISCNPVQKTWDLSVQGGSCWAPTVTTNYNIFSGAYSALMDLVLASLPWKFLWGLQMKRSEKIGVGIAMSMGVFAGITAIIKTTMIPRMLSSDFAAGVDLWIWGNAETCASIIAASIPMLRVLVRDAKSSRNYQTGYDAQPGLTGGGNHSRFVTITSKAAPEASDVELDKFNGDDRSDRSILGNKADGNGDSKASQSGIVQVTNFTVKYDEDNERNG